MEKTSEKGGRNRKEGGGAQAECGGCFGKKEKSEERAAKKADLLLLPFLSSHSLALTLSLRVQPPRPSLAKASAAFD